MDAFSRGAGCVTSGSRRSDALAGREIFIEFIEMGHVVRVAAVDAATGEEAVIQAPKSATKAEMERVAVAKLAKKLGLQPENETRRSGRKGLGVIV